MPATFTHSPAETERKEPGIGGKPPVDRRPTGGGGGGGDDDRQHERRGPRELLHKIRFSVFSILAADMMFFAILVALFFARQAGTHMDPRTHEQIGDWHPVLLPPILYLNTALLLLSSLTMEIARRNIFREIDVSGGMAGPRPSGASAHPALDGRNPGAWKPVPGRSMGRVAPTDRSGICIQPLVDARQAISSTSLPVFTRRT